MTIAFRDDMIAGDWRNASHEAGLSAASLATDPLPSYAQIARQAWDDQRRVANMSANAVNLETIYDEINDRVRAATGARHEELVNPLNGWNLGVTDVGPLVGMAPQRTVDIWRQQIAALRARHADKLDWDALLEEPNRRAWQLMKETREAANRQNERLGMIEGREIPGLGWVPLARELGAFGANLATSPVVTLSQLAGSFAGSLTSPIDAGVNLVGFAAGGAAKSYLSNALRNAASNLIGQVPLSAYKQLDYEKAGLPYGFKVWLQEVEGAAASGAAIDLAARVPVREVRRLAGAKGLGGFFTDAVPAPRIEAEIFAKAQAGDLAATREILAKTGALDDPAVRGALEHAEIHGRLDEVALARLKEVGVAPSEGMRVLDGLMEHRYVRPVDLAVAIDRIENPSAPAIPETDVARVVATAKPQLDAVAPRLGETVAAAVEARVPEIEGLVRTAAERLAAKADPAVVAADLAKEVGAVLADPVKAQGIANRIRLASGQASPAEVARMIQAEPALKAELNPELGRHAMALSLSHLSEADLARVARGEVPAVIAAHIAEHVPPEFHAQAMDDMARARPQSLDEAAALLDELVPGEPRELQKRGPVDATGIDDPAGPAAKAQIERLRAGAAEAVARAEQPIKERDRLASAVETLKGEIAKAEAAAEPARYADPATGERMSRGDIESIVDMWSYVEEMRHAPEPERLAQFIKRHGGIIDDDGDVRHLIGGARSRPGLVNGRGLEPDTAARLAWDAGYLHSIDRPDITALLDALGEDANGRPIYRADDFGRVEDIATARDMAIELERYGIGQVRSADEIRAHFEQGQGREGTGSRAADAGEARGDGHGLADLRARLADTEAQLAAAEARLVDLASPDREAAHPILDTEFAAIDRMGHLATLIESCRA